MIGNDEEGSQHASSLPPISLDFKLCWQHQLKNQVILVSNQIWHQLADTDQVSLTVEIVTQIGHLLLIVTILMTCKK